MNERIKELSDIAYKNHLKNNPESSFGRRTDYDKEFAELIVRECVNVVEDAGGIDKYHYTRAIGKHFGVEE